MKTNCLLRLAVLGFILSFFTGCESSKDSTESVESIYNPTLNYGTVKDVDGNVYKTIVIGSRTWMASNLKTTKFNDSTNISLIYDNSEWSKATQAAFCYYDNDKRLKDSYGILYNWYVVASDKICPEGFHVPTDAEWTQLEIYLQNHNYNYNGIIDNDNDRFTNNNIAKALASTCNWLESDYEGSVGNADYQMFRNKSGFSAIPSGYRNYDGTYHDRGYAVYWWTSTEYTTNNAWNRYLAFDYVNVFRMDYLKNIGFSICCVMDTAK